MADQASAVIHNAAAGGQNFAYARPSTRHKTPGGNNAPHARTVHNAQSLPAPAAVCGLVVCARLYIDRINVSFAGLTMRSDLDMSAGTFGFAVGMFYWAISSSRCRAT